MFAGELVLLLAAFHNHEVQAKAEQQVDQFLICTERAYGYELEGAWTSDSSGPITQLLPTNDSCAVILHLTATTSHRFSVAASGEVYMLANVIIGDTASRGNILFGPISPNDAFACNDYVRSNVQGVSFSGGCWNPITVDQVTGAWEKKCGKDNGEACNALVTYTGSPPPTSEEFTWECTSQGGSRKATGNNQSGTFTGHCAN